jgi:hypothetical protein
MVEFLMVYKEEVVAGDVGSGQGQLEGTRAELFEDWAAQVNARPKSHRAIRA